MTCAACLKSNLPGGVRCAYCGTHFPAGLDFEVPAAPPSTTVNSAAGTTGAGGRAGGILGTLAVLALKGKSLLGLLKFGKILTTLSSMFVFIWADALIFGWKFGAGIAVCIFIHEMGHVVVNWCKGIKQSAPMFIPFVGAVIFIKRFPDDPAAQSESGAGGPAAGFLAALGCLLIGAITGNPFWIALANVGFMINLFNLMPFPPLDGSHVSTVFSPRIWSCVLIAMLLWVLKAPSGMLWIILIVSFLFRLSANDGRYLLARPAVRLRMAIIYVVLCIGMSYGAEHTISARSGFGGLAGA